MVTAGGEIVISGDTRSFITTAILRDVYRIDA